MNGEIIKYVIEGVVTIALAILGGRWYFNKRKISQKNGKDQFAFQNSDNNKVNVGEKGGYKKEN